MTRNSRTPKIKLIHKLEQAQKISIKSYRLLRSLIVLKNLNEPLVSLTHKHIQKYLKQRSPNRFFSLSELHSNIKTFMKNINQMSEVSQDIEKYTPKLAQSYCIMPPGERCILSNVFSTMKKKSNTKNIYPKFHKIRRKCPLRIEERTLKRTPKISQNGSHCRGTCELTLGVISKTYEKN